MTTQTFDAQIFNEDQLEAVQGGAYWQRANPVECPCRVGRQGGVFSHGGGAGDSQVYVPFG